MRNQFKVYLLMAALLSLLPSAAYSQNLVTNSGFETGDFSGWTQFGDTSFTGVCPAGSPSADCSGYTPRTGSWFASFGPITSTGGVTQILNTVPGQTYSISFYLSNNAQYPNHYSVDFGDVTLTSGTDVGTWRWLPFQFTEVATSDQTALTFSFYQVPAYFDLDDVSVEVVNTPEPSALMLLAAPLVGLGWVRRKI